MSNNGHMIVIADDITGAAEMAGIAFSRGQQVRLVCGDAIATDGTTVIATDTRSMSEAEAATETRRIASTYWGEVGGGLLFKKTDSALRGHVIAELTALMQVTGYQRAVYLPANPSKGRIICNGIYYINNVPIHETDFSFDPEFPAKTSVLKERFPDAERCGIVMPDAETTEDIRRVVARYNDGKTLFAGAADLFAVLLESAVDHVDHGDGSPDQSHLATTDQENCPHDTLILCGSTQSKPLDLGIPVAPMPRAVYDGSNDLGGWDTKAFDSVHSLILTIPYTHRTGKEVAVHLRTVMAEMAKNLIARHCPDQLIIEGGATAWATLQALGWTQFDVVSQIAPGVVQMSAAIACHASMSKKHVMVTLKPGSYPWGNLFSFSGNK